MRSRRAVVERWGVEPASIPDYLALVGDSADGYPGIPGFGAKTAAAILARYRTLEGIPARAADWNLGLRNGPQLNAVLRERWDEALLYRRLARLRTDSPLPQRDPDELRWDGADRARYQAFCDYLELPRLRNSPHRWREA